MKRDQLFRSVDFFFLKIENKEIVPPNMYTLNELYYRHTSEMVDDLLRDRDENSHCRLSN
jgi:hypothetical protein